MHVNAGALEISATTIFDNQVGIDPQGASEGGGMYVNGGQLTIDASLIYENSAARGGGIYVDRTATDIVNSTVSSNRSGHGIWVVVATSTSIRHSTIVENSGEGIRGSGVALDHTIVAQNLDGSINGLSNSAFYSFIRPPS